MPDEPSDDQLHPIQVFRRIVSEQPDSAAVRYPDAAPGALSYAQLDRASDHAAAMLAVRNVGPGDRVALVMTASTELVALVIAVVKRGAAYMIVDPRWPESRRDVILRDARPRLTVFSGQADENGADQCPAEELFPGSGDALPAPAVDPAPTDPMYVCYTSGTTGVPKGVVVRAASVLNLVTNTPEIRIFADDRVAQISAPSFDAFTYELWGALLSGAELIGSTKHVSTDPERLHDAVLAHRISVMFQTTSLFNLISEARPDTFTDMRLLLFGGERADLQAVRRVLEQAPQALVHCYGPTELTTFALVHPVVDLPADAQELPIGKPIGGCIAVLGEEMAHSGAPAHELLLGGRGLAAGYLNRPDATAERFLSGNPAVYRTGDLVREDRNGDFVFVGRADNQVKLRGHRIELEEIEAALLEHPYIRQAAVLPHGEGGVVVRLTAHVAYTQDRSADEILSDWEELYDTLYDGVRLEDADGAFAGWNSRRDHRPIPLAEMREWRSSTVDRIRRLRPSRVLEIGVGTGLLLTELVQECQEYWGTDISSAVLDRLARATAHHRVRPTLRRQRADDLTGLPEGHFDVVVLNSVVQYFPSVDYLTDVLRGIVRVSAPGAAVFLGDVRNAGLSEIYAEDIGVEIGDEEELLIHPDYFRELPEHVPGVARADIEIKRGLSRNELSTYRFDVTMRTVGDPPGSVEEKERVHDWHGHSLQEIEDELRKHPDDVQRWLSMPNARFPVHGPAAFDPEDVHDLASRVGREVLLDYADDLTCVDAVFGPAGVGALHAHSRTRQASPQWPQAFANTPATEARQALNVRDIRQHLRERLPHYMVPADIVIADALPLNTSGKIDRARLAGTADTAAEGPADPVQTVEELWLMELIAETLAVELRSVGPADDFFEMGGHSLLAAKLANRVRRLFDVEIAAPDLYEAPSARALVRFLKLSEHPVEATAAVSAPSGTHGGTPVPVPDRGELEALAHRSGSTASLAVLAHTLPAVGGELGLEWMRLWLWRSDQAPDRDSGTDFAAAEVDVKQPIDALLDDLTRQLAGPPDADTATEAPDLLVALTGADRITAEDRRAQPRVLDIDPYEAGAAIHAPDGEENG